MYVKPNNFHKKGKSMIQLACVFLTLLVMAGNFLTGGNTPARPSEPQDPSAVFAASLTKYYVGFIQTGPKWTAEVDDVTKQNRQYLREQVEANKLVGVGQVMDSQDLRWIFFFKESSLDAAKEIIATAPAVKAERFTGEVRQAWGTKGMGSKIADADKAKAMATGPKTTHFLAAFKKGSKWSADESEATRKLLQNHIANVVKLHQGGALKFYGAFDDRGDIRGFAVIQAKSMDAAKKLIKDDPAVKANWFTPEYYAFEVAEGVLP
jgi:uncharacterized protein YciI